MSLTTRLSDYLNLIPVINKDDKIGKYVGG